MMYVREIVGNALPAWWVGARVSQVTSRRAHLVRYNRSGRLVRKSVPLRDVVLAEPAPEGVPCKPLHKERGGMGMRNFPAALAARSTTL